MMTTFAGLMIDLPADWLDITDDGDPNCPPTLARQDGVGVIQFSVAHYQGGAPPNITLVELTSMFAEFAAAHGLQGEIEPDRGARSTVVGSCSRSRDEVLCAWYVSDGWSVATVTYNSQAVDDPATERELAIASEAVRTIGFLSR